MLRRRFLVTACGVIAGLALAMPAAAEEEICRPQKIIRYLDVDIAVTPPSGPADREVTLSARCLPADRSVIVWSGQDFDAVQPVGSGSISAGGNFESAATVPANAAPGQNYYFAIMIDDHIVGTGAFLVDGEAESVTQ